MKKAFMAVALAAALALGLGATGAASSPDPNGPAKKGLCTAAHNGNKNGHDKNGKPGPFQALDDAADEAGDGNGETTPEELRAFCEGMIGGNPDVRG